MAKSKQAYHILSMLYEAYTNENQCDTEGVQAAFESLYESMNGMTLQEMDRVIYPVCTLCGQHEEAGFIAGVQVGMMLAKELNMEIT